MAPLRLRFIRPCCRVGQPEHATSVASRRLAHESRVGGNKAETFGFGESDVKAVIGRMVEPCGNPGSGLEIRPHCDELDVGSRQKTRSERRLRLQSSLRRTFFRRML